jgi:hypothetical protein
MQIQVIAALLSGVLIAHSGIAEPQAHTRSQTTMQHVKGEFDVKMVPQDGKDAVVNIGHWTWEKTLHGPLSGSSKGEMLAAGNPAKGTAGYVAIEFFTGTLAGRSGSFCLQHSATMQDGAHQLIVQVVPGSGTGELQGISGNMKIVVEQGKHFYEFDYQLQP